VSGEDTSFIPGTPGNYRVQISIREQGTPANGWSISFPFTIE